MPGASAALPSKELSDEECRDLTRPMFRFKVHDRHFDEFHVLGHDVDIQEPFGHKTEHACVICGLGRYVQLALKP